MEIPMLDDTEAEYVLEPFNEGVPPEDVDSAKTLVLRRYFEVTGFDETNANAIFHHVVKLYGPPCSNCGRPLRTPQATWCAACGILVTE
jgi:hypothetical protein